MTPLLMRAFLALRSREEGQTLVEYALILVFVSVASIALLKVISASPSALLSEVSGDL